MGKLDLIGRTVFRLPNFAKSLLAKFVFAKNTSNLPWERVTKPDSFLCPGPCVALVLGGFEGRKEMALRLYRWRIIDHILTSGGIGVYSENRDTPEAELYKEFLIENGVNPEDITTETDSTTTFENIEFSLPIIMDWMKDCLLLDVPMAQSCPPLQVVIVTNHFHLKRSVLIFRRALKKLAKNEPLAKRIKLFWTAADCSTHITNWRKSEKGCMLVGKEALCLIRNRLFGKV